MTEAVISVASARERLLPALSVKSGEPADGYAPVTVANRKIFLPLTQPEFDRVTGLQRRNRRTAWSGVACLAFGAAMARFPVMLPLAIAIALLSALQWGLTWVLLRAYLPSMTVDGGRIRLVRVHEQFAAAVRGDS
ncbi:MAG: hypothetical protein P8I99_08920 [Acidimicrobiales bacterium]|nr:hypothetical protein [Acidimicrobiales bacterium]